MSSKKEDRTLPSEGSPEALRVDSVPAAFPVAVLPEGGVALDEPVTETGLPPSSRQPPPESNTHTGYSARFVERCVIGVGGMNQIVRAFDRNLRRDVAIKALLPDLAKDPIEVERFAAEARITGQLEHPYVVPVYELGNDPRKGRYLCMRLLEGRTLEETVDRAGLDRLKPDRLADLLQVFLKVCEAVAFAHSKGIIHRDLKPANVMISDFGQVYVLDWGIARRMVPLEASATQIDVDEGGIESDPDPPGLLVGTPSYMAPEQLWGLHDEVGTHSDVFTLGAMLYYILCGRPPRLGDGKRSLFIGEQGSTIPPPEDVVSGAVVPSELSRICQKAMAHEARSRHTSVDELRSDVERFLRGSWHLPRIHFPAGSIIMAEGEVGETAYIILEGRCAAFRVDDDLETELREMGPGEVFGETAILSSKPRSASVRAVTDVLAMVVTAETLSTALGLNDWMGTFVKALANRFREVDERLRQLERRSVQPR
jgi:serine/threonine-protein kinase